MALVVICGQPCSGKTTAVRRLADALDSAEPKPTVRIIDEASLHLGRNQSYADMVSEKNLRGVLRSEVDRSVSKANIIIIDSLNSIKVEMDGYLFYTHCGFRCYISVHAQWVMSNPRRGLYYKCNICGMVVDASTIPSQQRDLAGECSAIACLLLHAHTELINTIRMKDRQIADLTEERDRYKMLYEAAMSTSKPPPLPSREEISYLRDIEEDNISADSPKHW